MQLFISKIYVYIKKIITSTWLFATFMPLLPNTINHFFLTLQNLENFVG